MVLRVIVFEVLMYFFLILLGGGSQALGLPPELNFAQWGPGIAGLLMLLIFSKDQHKLTFFSRETPVRRYLFAAAMPVAAAFVVYLITRTMNYGETASGQAMGNLLLLILWTPIGALGEEIGWRGYLHKRLDTRLTGILSSVSLGFLWMLMHVPLFEKGLVYMLFVTLLIVSYSIVLYALTQDTGFSVLTATIFHTLINYSNLVFLDIFNEVSFMATMAFVWVVIAVMTVFLRREQFFQRREVPTAT